MNTIGLSPSSTTHRCISNSNSRLNHNYNIYMFISMRRIIFILIYKLSLFVAISLLILKLIKQF